MGGATNNAPRSQKTARAGGERLGVLKDPRPPWVEAFTVGYVAAGAPLPVVPTLRGDDGVDGTTISFLLKVALQVKKKERRRRQKLEEKEEEEEKKVKEKLERTR